MYLFFFAVLFIIFQYMNEKTIFESQERQITSLTEKAVKAADSVETLNNRVLDLNYFTLQGNENAVSYFEGIGLDAQKVEAMVSDIIYDKNVEAGGNSLIPMEGINGVMRINKLKFLNHKWILADFSDGTHWGEVVIEYFFDEKNELHLKTLSSTLYPSK
ncbi:hypothetical protein [Ulvibacter litoralis]|uniref:Hydrolase n=2 Tax=Ulvibacter litoralis TaxID=227084 RepID=A0A1G7F923_9FLAO|nr:hypothetical protein [Ulvibacter litoralis]SDE72397.1 hypothetical protein SAMN05421855_102412 [Ulvibacter litoralis]